MQLFWEGQKQPLEVFYKKVVLKSLANLTQVFSYEICEIFKNTFFQEHL